MCDEGTGQATKPACPARCSLEKRNSRSQLGAYVSGLVHQPAAKPWPSGLLGAVPPRVPLPGAGPHSAAWKSSPPLSRLPPASSRAWGRGQQDGVQLQ